MAPIRVLLALLSFLALSACAVPDVQPATDTIAGLHAQHETDLARELALAARIEDPAARAEWERAARDAAERRDDLTESLLEWVGAIGQVDWRVIWRQMREETAR